MPLNTLTHVLPDRRHLPRRQLKEVYGVELIMSRTRTSLKWNRCSCLNLTSSPLHLTSSPSGKLFTLMYLAA